MHITLFSNRKQSEDKHKHNHENIIAIQCKGLCYKPIGNSLITKEEIDLAMKANIYFHRIQKYLKQEQLILLT